MIRTYTMWALCAGAIAHGAEFTTFIGGAVPLQVTRAVADAAGNTYIGGTSPQGVFVTKLDPAGRTIFFRNISGHGGDKAADLAIDAAGNIYVGGATTSSDFPLHGAMQSTAGPGFLTKLSADGSDLIWSTYFREAIAALAVDSAGNVYITGSTDDEQFPVTAGLPKGVLANNVGGPAFAAYFSKISAAGDRIVYSTVISGGLKECGSGSTCFLSSPTTRGVSVSVDPSGNAYLAGNTDTGDLPVTPGAFLRNGTGAFVAKFRADGSALTYLTYIGATHYPLLSSTNPANTAAALACDAAGNAYLTGVTSDVMFPATPGAVQATLSVPASGQFFSPPPDAFALKLSADGSAVSWGTYLGGAAVEKANSIAVDSTGQVWIAGTTASPTFPNAQGWSQGGDFLAGFNSTGTKLVYSARYPDGSASRSVSVDGADVLRVAGLGGIVSAIQPGAPPLPRVFGVANAASGSPGGVVAPGEVVAIYGPHIGPATPAVTAPDDSGNLPTSIAGYQVVADLTQSNTLPRRTIPTPLPLLYGSDSQINAVLPSGYFLDAPMRVVGPSGTTPDFALTIVAARPGIFHNPDGSAIAINQDGTLNSLANPAAIGSYVAIWATGSGLPTNGNAGQVTKTPTNYRCCAVHTGFGFLPVIYGGTAPGAIGAVSQVNFQLPTEALYYTPVMIQLVASDGSMSDPAGVHYR